MKKLLVLGLSFMLLGCMQPKSEESAPPAPETAVVKEAEKAMDAAEETMEKAVDMAEEMEEKAEDLEVEMEAEEAAE